MKRRSILITCIAALMALAVFVGCEQSVPFKYVTQYSVESEDFLVGQTFEPSKVMVNVTYSDGSSQTKAAVISGATGVTAGKVTGPITVTFNPGLNIYGEMITASTYIDVYKATGLTVTAPASIAIDGGNGLLTVDGAALFSVEAAYANGTVKLAATDYTVTIASENIKEGETGEGTATVSFGGVETVLDVTVENSTEPTPVVPEDFDDYVWDNTSLAYSVVPMTTENGISYFQGAEFDGKAMIQLYRVRTQASNSAKVYELIDSDDVEYVLEDYLDAEHKSNFTNTQAFARVSAKYTYVKAEDEVTGRKTILESVGTVLTNVKETGVEGLYTANAATNDTGYLVINLMTDYIVGLSAVRTTGMPFVVGNGASAADFTVKATYKSGNTATLASTAYTVDTKALALDDKEIEITLVNTAEEELYPDGVTKTTAAITVVENYPTKVELTANGYKKFGEAYTIADFTPSITWAKTATYDAENPAPVTISYTFEPATPDPEKIGTTNEVKFTWQCNEYPVVKGEGTVSIGVMDVPTSVVFATTTDTLSANQLIDDSKYSCTVTWASGKTGSDINGFAFDITQENATGNSGETIQLTGTWSCDGGFKGNVENSITVTLV